MTDAELRAANPRPRTRADCVNAPRPCPWLSCQYHTALDVQGKRSNQIRLSDGSLHTPHTADMTGEEIGEFIDTLHDRPTCALDVAASGAEMDFIEVGDIIGVSRSAVEQSTRKAAAKIAPLLAELLEVELPKKREIGDVARCKLWSCRRKFKAGLRQEYCGAECRKQGRLDRNRKYNERRGIGDGAIGGRDKVGPPCVATEPGREARPNGFLVPRTRTRTT